MGRDPVEMLAYWAKNPIQRYLVLIAYIILSIESPYSTSELWTDGCLLFPKLDDFYIY